MRSSSEGERSARARSLAGVELRDAEKQIINNAGKRARLTSTPAAREALLCAARHLKSLATHCS